MVVNELLGTKNWDPLKPQLEKNPDQSIIRSDKFKDTIQEFIHDVDNLEKEADELRDKLIKGEPVDIHDVMISAQKAKTSFELLTELRNKGLDLYRETLRMQV